MEKGKWKKEKGKSEILEDFIPLADWMSANFVGIRIPEDFTTINLQDGDSISNGE